ncbi:MAG: mycothiol transferase [Aeromicrobium sp.]
MTRRSARTPTSKTWMPHTRQRPSSAQDEWAASDRAVAGLDFETPVSARADVLALRFVYVHMIGEYARHNGHADLLCQSIDGTTGR